MKRFFLIIFGIGNFILAFGQNTNGGWISFGMRSTLSAFSEDGAGYGAGGQFRIQLANRVNTDWFGDYITININDKVRSEYVHIGWSVLFYPFVNEAKIQPYILAGHCFDYNKKTVIANPYVSRDRWGSAVQMGLGTHFHLTERFDLSLTCQYMIHLTEELYIDENLGTVKIESHKHSALEGHLLTTIGINYKIAKLWNR